jgi:hypothetical protein
MTPPSSFLISGCLTTVLVRGVYEYNRGSWVKTNVMLLRNTVIVTARMFILKNVNVTVSKKSANEKPHKI